MILVILQACSLLISQEVHYSMRYRCALIAMRRIIRCIKGVAWR